MGLCCGFFFPESVHRPRFGQLASGRSESERSERPFHHHVLSVRPTRTSLYWYCTKVQDDKKTPRMALQPLRASSLSLTRHLHCPLSVSPQRYRNVTHLASIGTRSGDGPPTSPLYPRTKTANATHPTNNPNKKRHPNGNIKPDDDDNPLRLDLSQLATPQTYRIHVSCTPNNTHVVISDPQGRALKAGSWTGGSCGFKGVNRSGYEAGYQCAVRAFARIKQLAEEEGSIGAGVGVGLLPRARFEVLFRGFGQGRDAVFKALMTSEGDDVRPYVVRVTDKTPIKIGGTRARKTRRL